MTWILCVMQAVWQVVLMMAPYLLLGFAVAGVLSVLLTPAWVARHMGRRGVWQVVKAALIGIPLPLCSCGVLPLAFSLRRDGARKGATVSFLAATPQIGVNSILLTWSLLGPVVMGMRIVVAFLSAVVAGLLIDWVEPDPLDVSSGAVASGCCTADARMPHNPEPVWRRALHHGFVTLPSDMARPLFLGVLISGVVTALVPDNVFAGHLSPGVSAYLLAMVIGLPLYVCSASSVPLAVSLIHMGASPGATLVFLITGPATNAASVMTLWRQIGHAGTAVYLLAIGAVAILAGGILDLTLTGLRESLPLVQAHGAHSAQHGSGAMGIEGVAAVLFLLLLVPGLAGKGGRGTDGSGSVSR